MIFDLHNDLFTSEINDKEYECNKSLLETKGIVFAFWSTESIGFPKYFQLRKKHIKFAIEDMHFFREEMIEELISFSPVYCGLTWNYNNSLAGGAMDDGGLTVWGRRVIDILNENRITVDLAHLNGKSFYQVIERADRVICSHTAVDALKNHQRNLTNEQIRLIIEKGGIIGLTPVRAFLKNNGNIEDFAQTLDYAVSNFGANNFAIGTDINGSTDFCRQLSNYDGYNDLKKILVTYGYDEKEINKVFYRNAKNFCDTTRN